VTACGRRRPGYPSVTRTASGAEAATQGGHIRILLRIVALLLLSVGGVRVLADSRRRATTAAVIVRLHSGRTGSPSAMVSATTIEGLPAPVRRSFRAVLREGQPLVRCMQLSQHRDSLLRPASNGWRPFTATQDVATPPPGFVWDADIRMAPGLVVPVRDALVDGTGSMLASLMGVVPLAAVEATPGIPAGVLHRYLAEAVWCPAAL